MNWIQIQGFFVTWWSLSVKAVKEEKAGFGLLLLLLLSVDYYYHYHYYYYYYSINRPFGLFDLFSQFRPRETVFQGSALSHGLK